MKIPNPWPYHPMSRITCRIDGREDDVQCIVATRDVELEVPDGTVEAVIEPVTQRGEIKAVGSPRVWSEAWGLLDIEDHLTKLELAKERAALEAAGAEMTNGPQILTDKDELDRLKSQKVPTSFPRERKPKKVGRA